MKGWLLYKAVLVAMSGFLMNGDISESGSKVVNHPPVLREEVTDPEQIFPWVVYEIDVSHVFSDEDGDELVFTAMSQSESVAKVEVEGSMIKVMAQKTGRVTIIVTASDQRGGTASTAYRFIVTE
ncbi:hypothetical protein [Brevibacillus choshinensis]|uniref:BIG2 domain-containing protein n=1 Tax=Brevibacillus choshinensis TaxID=54911 RepID=A0ABX7FIP0_BRECH|nr:hypothetical protein [Brevibacillus choshinensis]QRG65137.1 hypothetical protein JNE38_15920 [Brevibacillus choshinensis]